MNKWIVLIGFIILGQIAIWEIFLNPVMNIINIIGWIVALKLTIWRDKK